MPLIAALGTEEERADDSKRMNATTSSQLPAKWANYLQKLPETGMDYQVIDVVLNDGTVYKDVAVIHCSHIGEVRGHNAVPFNPNEIAEIHLTHNKWKWRT